MIAGQARYAIYEPDEYRHADCHFAQYGVPKMAIWAQKKETIEDKIIPLVQAEVRKHFNDETLTVNGVWLQRGGYTHRTWDLARWGCVIQRNGENFKSAFSWAKASDCIKHGIILTEDDGDIEISKKTS